MSIRDIHRRQFLTLVLALLVPRWAGAATETRRGTYAAEVGVLWNLLRFRLEGTLEETIDRAAGRYRVTLVGEGTGIGNRFESVGALRAGRWVPLKTSSWLDVYGRGSQLDVTYDHDGGAIEYRSRAETFFLRRLRVVDDRVFVPTGLHVDDGASAALNWAEQRWPPEADGTLRTHIVRRRRSEGEEMDAAGRYQAELARFDLRVAADPDTGKATVLVDLTRFSAWAQESRPARIVFGANRRPQLITSSLGLGTSVTIRLNPA
jgi:hypothetical protein